MDDDDGNTAVLVRVPKSFGPGKKKQANLSILLGTNTDSVTKIGPKPRPWRNPKPECLLKPRYCTGRIMGGRLLSLGRLGTCAWLRWPF